MKRFACAVLLVATSFGLASCGGGGSALPTPRPSGQRGGLLNPIDKANNTVNRLNNQQQQQEQQTGSGYNP